MTDEGVAMVGSTGRDARTTLRWAVGVLVVATLGLGAYLALVTAASWLVIAAVDVVLGRRSGTLDVTGLLVDVTPGVALGWAVGLVAAALLRRGRTLGARSAGLAAGVLGAVTGAALLAARGVL